MRILTYKRTHTGDPDSRGIFGINDCMGTVRNRNFDAVVGIGSKCPWNDSLAIAGKVTWVGVGPFRLSLPNYRGDLVSFEKFVLLDGHGPDFETLAPKLAKRFYHDGARAIINSYSKEEKGELNYLIAQILQSPHLMKSDFVNDRDKLACRRKKCKKKFTQKCQS